MWNSMRPLLVIASAALNVAFVAAWLVVAADSVSPSPRDQGAPEAVGRNCPLHRQLGITDAQWDKLEPALRPFREETSQLARQIHQRRHELLDLLFAAQPNREVIDAKQQEVLAGQDRMQRLVIGQILAEREILTPDQQQRLFALVHEEMRFTDSCPMMGLGQGGGKGIGRVLREGAEDQRRPTAEPMTNP